MSRRRITLAAAIPELLLSWVVTAAGDVADGFAVVRTTTAEGRLLADASVVDNQTGDPINIPGM